jgi:hypothetical protein
MRKEEQGRQASLEALAEDARRIVSLAHSYPLAALSVLREYKGDRGPLYGNIAIYATANAENAERNNNPATAELWNHIADYCMAHSGIGQKRKHMKVYTKRS